MFVLVKKKQQNRSQASQLLPTRATARELLKCVWATSQQSECAQFSFDQCSATDGTKTRNLQKLTPEIHNVMSTPRPPCLRAAVESSDLVNIEDLKIERSVSRPNCSPFQVTYSASSPPPPLSASWSLLLLLLLP